MSRTTYVENMYPNKLGGYTIEYQTPISSGTVEFKGDPKSQKLMLKFLKLIRKQGGQCNGRKVRH